MRVAFAAMCMGMSGMRNQIDVQHFAAGDRDGHVAPRIEVEADALDAIGRIERLECIHHPDDLEMDVLACRRCYLQRCVVGTAVGQLQPAY